MSRQPWSRLAAWLIDWLCISAWVAVLAAVGSALYFSGTVVDLNVGVANAVGFLVLIVPVTLVLAWLESDPRGATIGKRSRRLRVVDASSGSGVPFRRTLVRNALKIALPWEFAHTVVFGLFGTPNGSSISAWMAVATVAAYVLPAIYVVALFVGRGRTPYDLMSRTVVTVQPPAGGTLGFDA